MTRRRRILLRIALAAAGLGLAALAGTVLLVRSAWFGERVRERIVREIERATGGRAEVGSFRFDWKRLTAEVRALTLHGAEPEDAPPLFQAESVEAGLKIISVARRDIDIDSLAIRGPRLHIVVNQDGSTNLPRPEAARRPRHPVEQFLALAIGRFRVEGGVVEVNDRRLPVDLRGERLAARLAYERGGPRYSGNISFRRLSIERAGFPPVALDADLDLSLEANRLTVREARLAWGRSTARLNGSVEDLLAPRVKMEGQAGVWLAEAAARAGVAGAVRGEAAVTGELAYSAAAGFQFEGQVEGEGLAAHAGGVDVNNVRLSSRLRVTPAAAELAGLRVSVLGGEVAGSARIDGGRTLHAAADLRGFKVSDLAALRRLAAPPWEGLVSGPVVLDAAIASGRLRDAELTAKLTLEPGGAPRPLSGFLDVRLSQRGGTIQFADSHLAAGSTRIELSGELRQGLHLELATRDLGELAPLGAYLGSEFAKDLPVALRDGEARFRGVLTGGLDSPRASGQASLTNVVYRGQVFDRVSASVTASEDGIAAEGLSVESGGATLRGRARAALSHWKITETGAVSGTFALRALPLEVLAAAAGVKTPVRGSAAGTIEVGGTAGAPKAAATLTISEAGVLGRRVREARFQARYASRALTVESFDADTGMGAVSGSALFTHREDDLRSGTLRFNGAAKGVDLDLLRSGASWPEAIEGVIDGQFRGALAVDGGAAVLTELQGKAASRVRWKGKPAGELAASAASQGGALSLTVDGRAFGVKFQAAADVVLDRDYPVRGELSFARVSVAELRPWLELAGIPAPPLDASADGRVYLSGLAGRPETLRARIELPGVDVLPTPVKGAGAPRLRNSGLVVLSASRKFVRVVSAYFAGPDTNLEVTGGVDLATRYNAYDLRVKGRVDLNVLHSFDANLAASGDSTVDANVRGRLSKPELYGRLEFKQASLNLTNVPNGVENASGVVLFSRDRATIENLTAETGGGKISVKGYVGLGGPQWIYRLQATASRVRVRYPEGVSTTIDGAVDLTGTSERSLLSGTVTILRSGVSPGVDLASLVARASRPMVTPATTNELLGGMQFDLRVAAAADARFDTMITRDVQVEAEMRLRGTPYKPVLLGRVTVSRGEVLFLGNTYSISRGEVSFLNPVRLEPC
jgi:translocation and assembly module TamB